ncbi:hypothetical protein MHU86_23293 [Fragilaria crotonensis]|nr:hypothetical protein MHU86_23293 [Fragilaria crotonensis]
MKITLTAACILISLPDSTAMGSTGTKRHANSNSAGLRGGQEFRTTAWHTRTVGAMNGMARHRESTGQLYDSNSVHWATGVAMMQETERTGGTCGDGNVGNGLCPMAGQCCSTYGWCGVGPEYCTGTTVPATSGPLPTPAVTWAPLQVTAPPVLAPVGIAPQAPVGVSPEAPVGGFSEAPVGVFSEAPVGVSPEAPVGGSPEAPVGGSPEAPVGGFSEAPVGVSPEAPVGVSPEAPVGGSPEAPVGGFSEAPVGGSSKAPVGGFPEAPVGGSPEAPVSAPPVIGRPTAPIASGTCGNGMVGNGICSTPQDCCSSFGWCGVGPEYCTGPTIPAPNTPTSPLPTPAIPTAPVMAPSSVITPTAPSAVTSIQFPDYADGECSGVENVMTVNVGYYQSWSATRGCNPVVPSAIDVGGNGYTHLIYSFASINANFQLEAWGGASDSEVPQYQALNNLKQTHPELKTLIAVGGWTFNDPGPTQTRFSETASTPENRAAFAASCVQFCQQHGFDGVDLDWEYPGDPTRGGQAADKANFGLLVDAIRAAFDAAPVALELTMAVPIFQGKLTDGYDLPALAKGLDLFNLMAYDVHGEWDNPKVIGANSDLPAIFDAVRYFLDAGVASSKMALGLAAYGRSYILADPSCTTGGCAFQARALVDVQEQQASCLIMPSMSSFRAAITIPFGTIPTVRPWRWLSMAMS